LSWMENGDSVSRKVFLIRAGWPVAATLMVALFGYLIFAGHYDEMARRIDLEKAAADRIQIDLRNSQKTIDDLAKARESVSEYLPEIFKIGDTQSLIDRMAEKADLEGAAMVDIQLDVPKYMEIRKADDPVFPVPFQASFAGDFFTLGSLLSSLEKAPFVYKVTEVGLATSADVKRPLTMTLKGAVRFFSSDVVERYLSDGT
jgi:hypothetical protein